MCGRFVIDDSGDIAEMRRIFEELKKHYDDTVEFKNVKSGEIFPSDTVPVIIPEKDMKIDAVPMQWGFKSSYNGNLLINARSEGVYDKKMFKDSIINKRCVIPSNGFFEWAKLQDKKEKYLIRPAGSPMLYFAGIYEKLSDPKIPDKYQIRFVIMTRESRGLIRSLHERMPVTVERKNILKWLNGTKSDINEFFTDYAVPEYTFANLGAAG
ncbi:MAG: SOS response-associated peptidase [Oscillospiraceae bacterium]|nr:SOS response-associated peptidase [Oscillospiraceae bacterium]